MVSGSGKWVKRLPPFIVTKKPPNSPYEIRQIPLSISLISVARLCTSTIEKMLIEMPKFRHNRIPIQSIKWIYLIKFSHGFTFKYKSSYVHIHPMINLNFEPELELKVQLKISNVYSLTGQAKQKTPQVHNQVLQRSFLVL